jgi:hypothetical protein
VTNDIDVRTGGDGFADAVTVSFADDERGWYGLARIGLAGQGSALAVLFEGREVAGALAQGALGAPEGGDWSAISLGGLRHGVDVPFERWTLGWEGEDAGFDLVLEAVSAPAHLSAYVADLGGMEGYDQLIAVRGTVRSGETRVEIDGLGQRGRSWGVADWNSLQLTRTVSAWMGADRGGVVLSSLRPRKAKNHDDERVWAAVVEGGEPAEVYDPRLSTTYDGDGHQRRAGLELWMEEEGGLPVRAAGEVLCGSSLDLGALRLDLAFMRWRADGVVGVGRYDILRKT